MSQKEKEGNLPPEGSGKVIDLRERAVEKKRKKERDERREKRNERINNFQTRAAEIINLANSDNLEEAREQSITLQEELKTEKRDLDKEIKNLEEEKQKEIENPNSSGFSEIIKVIEEEITEISAAKASVMVSWLNLEVFFKKMDRERSQ